MNAKQKKTLAMIFERPTRPDISWQETVSLLLAIGVIMQEGKGSRVRFGKGSSNLHIHKPHPAKVLRKYSVDLVRDFLIEIGEKP